MSGHSTDKSISRVTCFTEALRAIKQGIAAADDSTLDDAREVGGRNVHLLPWSLAPAGTVEGSTHAANDLFPPQEEALAFQSVWGGPANLRAIQAATERAAQASAHKEKHRGDKGA